MSSCSDPTPRLLEIKHSMPPASELPLSSRELNRSNLPSEVGELEPVDIMVLGDVDELGVGVTWAKFVNPFEVQCIEKTLAARVSLQQQLVKSYKL